MEINLCRMRIQQLLLVVVGLFVMGIYGTTQIQVDQDLVVLQDLQDLLVKMVMMVMIQQHQDHQDLLVLLDHLELVDLVVHLHFYS
tara:strand:- start:176 stop:433 length:258 start_codon:yes stop_codon:yes gene_type:complete